MLNSFRPKPGPEVIKKLLALNSSTKFQLLIKTKIMTNKEVSQMLYLSC